MTSRDPRAALGGEVAIVTGAAEGIGRAIAERLAGEGASVLLNDLDAGKAERVAAEIRTNGGRCEALSGDASEVETVRALVDAAVERFGKITLLAANAGITAWSPFLETEPADFDGVIALNLRGTYFLAQAAARRMVDQKTGGAIVLTSSIAGRVASPADIANAVAFLLSPASEQVRGQTLLVDGGWSIRGSMS